MCASTRTQVRAPPESGWYIEAITFQVCPIKNHPSWGLGLKFWRSASFTPRSEKRSLRIPVLSVIAAMRYYARTSSRKCATFVIPSRTDLIIFRRSSLSHSLFPAYHPGMSKPTVRERNPLNVVHDDLANYRDSMPVNLRERCDYVICVGKNWRVKFAREYSRALRSILDSAYQLRAPNPEKQCEEDT